MKVINSNNYFKIFHFKNHTELVLSKMIVPEEFNSLIFIYNSSISIYIENVHKSITPEFLLFIPKYSTYKINFSNATINTKLYILTFSSNIFIEVPYSNFNLFIRLLNNHKFFSIPISSDEIHLLKTIVKLLYYSQNYKHLTIETDIIRVIMNFFSHKCIEIQNNQLIDSSNKRQLLFRYLENLTLHIITNHNVKFYADKLFITPGYLNKITKEYVGKSAKRLIEEALIIHAKILLHNEKLTITEIAENLHFSSTASFSVFFKQHTSLSPSEFRKQYI